MSRPTRGRAAPGGWLWLAVLAGPLAWTGQLLLGYLLVALWCSGHLGDVRPAVAAISLAAALLALGGVWIGWRRWRGEMTAAEPPSGRIRFMGQAAVLGGGAFLVAIAAEAIPSLTLPPCG